MFMRKNSHNKETQLNTAGDTETEIKMYKDAVLKRKKDTVFFWKSFIVTGVIIVIAFIAIIVTSIAWFAMNDRTQAHSSEITANGDATFFLATLEKDAQGVFDANEAEATDSLLAKALVKYLGAHDNGTGQVTKFLNLPNLSVGTNVVTDAKGDRYILADSENLSLMVSPTSNVNNTTETDRIGPGSYGKFTFYIIPQVDNLGQVNVSVSLKAYELVAPDDSPLNGSDTEAKARLVEKNSDTLVLLNMLQGHMLLFTGVDADGNYTGHIEPELQEDGSVSFKFDLDREDKEWVINQAEPVTVYWIWPKRFENIKYCGQEDSVFKSECMEHAGLLAWINENRGCVVNTKKNNDVASLANPTGTMTNKQFAQWNVGYNQGDQLIGANIAFFQWEIAAQ